MLEFYQLIPSIAFITGKDYCQTGTLKELPYFRDNWLLSSGQRFWEMPSSLQIFNAIKDAALSLLFLAHDDYKCDVVKLGDIGCVV